MVSVSMGTSMAAASGSTLTSTIKEISITENTTSSFPTNVTSMGVKAMHQMQGRKGNIILS